MALVEIKVPSVGESVTEALLTQWYKEDGDLVRRDEALYVLETDKVTLEVTAEAAGRLKITVAAGTTVKIGAVVGGIDTDAAAAASEAGDQKAQKPEKEPAREEEPPAQPEKKPASKKAPAAGTPPRGSGRPGSPRPKHRRDPPRRPSPLLRWKGCRPRSGGWWPSTALTRAGFPAPAPAGGSPRATCCSSSSGNRSPPPQRPGPPRTRRRSARRANRWRRRSPESR